MGDYGNLQHRYRLRFLEQPHLGTIDYYWRNTKDLLNDIFVPAGSNFTNRIETNIGDVNALSSNFEVRSYRDGKVRCATFTKGELVTDHTEDTEEENGTYIFFKFPFDIPQYLLIDMQLGGTWVGPVDSTDLPVEMEVDWVRHYQWK